MKRTSIITVICIVLCVLAPHGELGARDAASPYTSESSDAPETPVGISKGDHDTLVIRIRLPRTRTVILALSAAALLATGTVVLRRRRTRGSAHTLDDTPVKRVAARRAETESVPEDTGDEQNVSEPIASPTVAPAESEPSSDSAASDSNDNTDDIDLPLLTPPSGSDMHMLRRLNEFITLHINEVDLSVNDLASAVYMSRSNLFRRLKTLYGITPNEYLRRKRLLLAAALLRQNRYAISDVCVMVGFSSPSYFASCFRKQFGVLPKNYIR